MLLNVNPHDMAIFYLCPYRFNIVCKDKLFKDKDKETGYYLAQYKSIIKTIGDFFSVDNEDRSLNRLKSLLRNNWNKSVFDNIKMEKEFGNKALEMLEWLYYSIDTEKEAYLQNRYLSINKNNYVMYYYLQRLDRTDTFDVIEHRIRKTKEVEKLLKLEVSFIRYLINLLLGIEIQSFTRYNLYTRSIISIRKDDLYDTDTINRIIENLDECFSMNRFETNESEWCEVCNIQFGCPAVLKRMSINKDAMRSLLISSDLFIKLGELEEEPATIIQYFIDYMKERFPAYNWEVDNEYNIICINKGEERGDIPEGWIEMIEEYFKSRISKAILYNQAIKDQLTELYNRGYFDRIIREKTEKIDNKENINKLSLILIDIDYFKKINDTMGHTIGDEVLKRVGCVIKDVCRDRGSIPCRYGGEEIAVITDEDISESLNIAESIRDRIKREKFNYKTNEFNVTLSAGIAEYYAGMGFLGLIDNTDAALYKAKINGRDRVEILKAYG
ncbi:MAG: GGDEF domain-containing protein [Candidatus Hydrogenedentota bacterium]